MLQLSFPQSTFETPRTRYSNNKITHVRLRHIQKETAVLHYLFLSGAKVVVILSVESPHSQWQWQLPKDRDCTARFDFLLEFSQAPKRLRPI